MNDKNKNLLSRLVTALALLPIVLWMLWEGGYVGSTLLGLTAALCVYEYLTITVKHLSPMGILTMVAAGAMPLFVTWKPFEAAALVCAAGGSVFFLSWIWHLLKGPLAEAPTLSAHMMAALIYGGTGTTAIAALRNLPDGGSWVVAALAITWGNDTSAYFAGRFLGKHKLYPEVSPNKTWEGFAGGLFGSVACLFIMKASVFPSLRVVDCLVVGLIGGLFGPAGDLCESMLKRAYGVKDSGTLLPGHGGMLDRIDALLFNAPVVLLYVQFIATRA